ncbi:hypothetical protein F5890DRAFT_1479111 [Lentinula detonsa]|uniref:Uncharacterized protein n=1 Tax=Lentinula detonsa TaxID=2804962 RepID=A0AA38PNC7_9AGAR|nr:hypothetical protein F5890DRAFT_1479111 [Lentinula detonsa]
MSTTSTTTETTQQRRERLLRVQAERQRAREAEEARQAAEFEAEMRVLEEEAAREAEIAAEKKRLEEQKLAEQKRRAEEKRKEAERDKQKEEDARAKVTEELAKRRELAAAAAICRSGPPTSQSALGSQPKPKKMVKSPSQVRDESEELTEEEDEQPAPRGVKRKMMTVMEVLPILTMGTIPRQEMTVEIPPPPLPRNRGHLATGVFYSTVKTNVARRRAINAHKLAPWSGENAARRSRAKKTKLEDEVYEGPARRVTERRIGMEQMAMFTEHCRDVGGSDEGKRSTARARAQT